MGGTTAKASVIEDGRLGQHRRIRSRRRHLAQQPAGEGRRLCAEASGHRCVRGRRRRRQHRLARRGRQLKVGPQSAGAVPGPGLLRRAAATEPTVTDANVVLGYLNPDAIAGGTVPIDMPRAAREALQKQIADPLGRPVRRHRATASIGIANATMMRAVKAVSTYRGRDPRDSPCSLLAATGACTRSALARALGMAGRGAAGGRRVQRLRAAVLPTSKSRSRRAS